MNTNDGSVLRHLGQKIPHLRYFMELFTERDRRYVWSNVRKARFERVREITLNCWRNMKSYARQMSADGEFRVLLSSLTRAVRALKWVHQLIHEAGRKRTYSAMLLNWDVGEGALLRPS